MKRESGKFTEVHEEGYSNYSGTKEELFAAGVAKPEWFADVGKHEPRRARYVRTWRFRDAGLRHTLTWRRDGTFELFIARHEPEAPNGDQVADFATFAKEFSRDRFERALAEPDGLRMLGLKDLDAGLQFIVMAFNLTDDPGRPYSFSETVKEEVKQRIAEIFRLWKANSASMIVRTAGMAARDPQLQRFLGGLLGSAK